MVFSRDYENLLLHHIYFAMPRLLPPADLPDAARTEWSRVVSSCPELTERDRPALYLYIETYTLWRAASERINPDAMTFETEVGAAIDPHVKLAGDLATRLVSLIDRLGLSPASRAKLFGRETLTRDLAEDPRPRGPATPTKEGLGGLIVRKP